MDSWDLMQRKRIEKQLRSLGDQFIPRIQRTEMPHNPPATFQNPSYGFISAITAVVNGPPSAHTYLVTDILNGVISNGLMAAGLRSANLIYNPFILEQFVMVLYDSTGRTIIMTAELPQNGPCP